MIPQNLSYPPQPQLQDYQEDHLLLHRFEPQNYFSEPQPYPNLLPGQCQIFSFTLLKLEGYYDTPPQPRAAIPPVLAYPIDQ